MAKIPDQLVLTLLIVTILKLLVLKFKMFVAMEKGLIYDNLRIMKLKTMFLTTTTKTESLYMMIHTIT